MNARRLAAVALAATFALAPTMPASAADSGPSNAWGLGDNDTVCYSKLSTDRWGYMQIAYVPGFFHPIYKGQCAYGVVSFVVFKGQILRSQWGFDYGDPARSQTYEIHADNVRLVLTGRNR